MATAYATSAEMIRKAIRERRRRQLHEQLRQCPLENALLHAQIHHRLEQALLVLDVHSCVNLN